MFNLCDKHKDEGTMEDWDQEKLEQVVASKSNEYNKNKPTDIVSICLLRWNSFLHCYLIVSLFDVVLLDYLLVLFYSLLEILIDGLDLLETSKHELYLHKEEK